MNWTGTRKKLAKPTITAVTAAIQFPFSFPPRQVVCQTCAIVFESIPLSSVNFASSLNDTTHIILSKR